MEERQREKRGRGAFRLASLGALLVMAMLVMTAGGALAAPVTLSGSVCAGGQQAVPGVFDPLTGLPVMEPVMTCSGVANAQAMVQTSDGGKFVTFATVDPTTGAWSATLDPASAALPPPYVIMFSAPGHDATSREVRIDANGGLKYLPTAYLPPLPHKKASLLLYAFKDDYLNSEDDFPDDPPLNGVTFQVFDERDNLVASGVSGDPLQPLAPGAGTSREGLYYFKDALEPGQYEVCVDMNTLPASPNNLGWYHNSTEEGGHCWDVTLYPGDPGTMAGGYMAWFSFVEKIGNSPLANINTMVPTLVPNPNNPADPNNPPTPNNQGNMITVMVPTVVANPAYGAQSITGVVRDADGPFFAFLGEAWAPTNPYITPNCEVNGALVVLWQPGVGAVATAETGVDGRFTFTNVAPGNYRVFFEDVALSYIWQEFQVTVPAATNVDIGYAYMPRWFARVNGYVVDVTGLSDAQIAEPAAASPISIDPTTLAENCINANLVTPPPPGTGVPNVKVRFRAKDGSIWKETTTDANGWYEFDGLNEIEVLGYVDVEQPANMHGRKVTETYPTVSYKREWGWSNFEGLGRTVPVIDWNLLNTYTFNLNNRAIGWFANNYRANLQIESIPAGAGDIRGTVYYDSLRPSTWTPDGVWQKDDERSLYGVEVGLYQADGTTPVYAADGLTPLKTKTGKNGKGTTPELKNQGYQGMGEVYPMDEFGGVFRWSTPGYYEFRGVAPGNYVVKVIQSSVPGYTPVEPGTGAPGTGESPVTVVDGGAATVDFGLTTYAPATLVAGAIPMGVPLSGEIEGGVFDDLYLQANTESILWDEKKPLTYAPISVYDHFGYFLGSGVMGNDLCHKFSHYADQNHDGVAGDVDPAVCPNGVELPEFEYRVASGPHIYVGNDPAEWLTNWQFTTPDGPITNENGMPILDANGNQIMGPSYAAGSKSVRTVGAAPWLPEGIYYPEYEPLPWTYTFGQGKYKYEADWSLLPLTLGEVLPNPIRGQNAPGGTLGNGVITPQNAPEISMATVEVVGAPSPFAFNGVPMLAMNDDGSVSLSDISNMVALLPATTINTLPGSSKVLHISGRNFGGAMGYSTVALSGRKLHAWKWSDTQIDVIVPESAVSGPLMVATINGVSNAMPVVVNSDEAKRRQHEATSVYVAAGSNGNGTEAYPFGTIREALASVAGSNNPVNVFVKPGVYKERVAITRSNVKLIGYGPQETTIDGIGRIVFDSLGARNLGGPVVSIGRGGLQGGVSNVTVSGFTITNGAVNYNANGGGGVFGDYGNRNIDINNNVIRNNGGEYGGGIWLHHSNHDVSIWSNVIALNGNTGGYGGGISVNDEPEYEVPGSTAPPESSPYHHTYDDAMYSTPPGSYNIYNNRIVRNFSMDYGGGVSLYEAKDKLNVYGNFMAENVTDDHGGAIFLEDSGPADIYDNVMIWNYAPDDGGAISIEDVGDNNATVNIYNNLIAENVADDRNENTALGGAIALDDALRVNIFGNSIIGNLAAGTIGPRGGAIAAERHGHEYASVGYGFSDPVVSNNIIWDNWRLDYSAPRAAMEGLNFGMGINYRWSADNLFNDDPTVNREWEQKNNANTIHSVTNNLISGGYTGVGNRDANSFFSDTTPSAWRLPRSGVATGAGAAAGALAAVRADGTAPISHPLISGSGMGVEALRTALSINSAANYFNLGLNSGTNASAGSVNLSVAYDYSLSSVSAGASAMASIPGVDFPLGTISFTVTGPKHGCTPTLFEFSQPLPARTALYNVKGGNGNVYDEIQYRRWSQTSDRTLVLDLCDGGDEDNDGHGNSTVTGTIAVGRVFNVPPVAHAGADQSLYTGQTVNLDGSASSDPDNAPIAFAWRMVSVPSGSGLKHWTANVSNPSFAPDAVGTYRAELTVSDDLFTSAADAVSIVVAPNLPPDAVASATPSEGFDNQLVTLDGSASTDRESNGPASYDWDFGDGTLVHGTTAVVTHGYAPGKYTARLTVTDDIGQTDEADVVITIRAANLPPSVEPKASPSGALVGQVVTFNANASDDEDITNDFVTVSWSFGDGTTADGMIASHAYAQAGQYTATATVSDGVHTVSRTVKVSVNSPLTVKTKEASVDLSDKGKNSGKVNYEASFAYGLGQAQSSDVVRVLFDGVELLNAQLSAFKTDGAGNYEYEGKNVSARVNFSTGSIKVVRSKMGTSGINNLNGIDVNIAIGVSEADDRFNMRQNGRDKLTYKANR